MEVVVTGMGLSTALGNRNQTWNRLLMGQSGIRVAQPFSELGARPLALIGNQPADLNTLLETTVEAALEDAQLTLPLPDCAVVIGSSRSHQGQWETWAKSMGKSPCLNQLPPWLDTLPHMPAVSVARSLQSTQPVLAPMAACATGLWAIARGYELIRSGYCQRAIVGAIETPITPLTLIGFQRMGALASTGAYPFDRQRQGLVLGEGSALFLLETLNLAEHRSVVPYGQILGFGLTADGYHVSAPDIGGQSAIIAVHHCLARSGLERDAIHYIHAHGTGTLLNDENEAQLIHHLFSNSVAISSTKGATGHTIGASGALGTAFCLLALRHQICPPSVGLTHSEFPLNFIKVGTELSRPLDQVLCFSFGFGGQNAVLALGRSP
ncbi:MAG: beta-ketoacyl-ACP synthase [Synechococcales bacterium]|nr:beta-ketoacyl-ACP synthase [Synechococcales bacterium]